MQKKTDNHSTHLNNRSICPSSVFLRSVSHCPYIIVLNLVDQRKTIDCVCICRECHLEVLQGYLYRECALQKFLILILSESQVRQMSTKETAYVRICYVKICMYTYNISIMYIVYLCCIYIVQCLISCLSLL